MGDPLRGFTVGITGDRRAGEQIELLTRRGATIVHGPTIEMRNLAASPELRRACEALVVEPPEVLVATTGVGMRSWIEAADDMGLGDDLRRALATAEVVSRSPKASGAAVTIGLDVAWQAAGERTVDVVEHLADRDLHGVRIAVQRDGSSRAVVADALHELGADVVDVPIYRWHLPTDPTPAHRLLDAIAERQLDAITVTSSPALANLTMLADERDDRRAVLDGLVDPQLLVACVGPVCAERARALGIVRIVQPRRFRLGSMVKVLADALAATAWTATVDRTSVRVQGGSALVDGEAVSLPRREQQLLARLATAAGGVVSKSELSRTVWGPDADPHVVEVAVARLRRRLGDASGLVVTVPRRGYRLATVPEPTSAPR